MQALVIFFFGQYGYCLTNMVNKHYNKKSGGTYIQGRHVKALVVFHGESTNNNSNKGKYRT